MIKAVLDTNILASGTVSAFNPPGKILDAWRTDQFELVTSEYILSELEPDFPTSPIFINFQPPKLVF